MRGRRRDDKNKKPKTTETTTTRSQDRTTTKTRSQEHDDNNKKKPRDDDDNKKMHLQIGVRQRTKSMGAEGEILSCDILKKVVCGIKTQPSQDKMGCEDKSWA